MDNYENMEIENCFYCKNKIKLYEPFKLNSSYKWVCKKCFPLLEKDLQAIDNNINQPLGWDETKNSGL